MRVWFITGTSSGVWRSVAERILAARLRRSGGSRRRSHFGRGGKGVMSFKRILTLTATVLALASQARAQQPNRVLGTWRMVTAQLDPEGRNIPAYGPRPNSLLVFTPDMHFIEVLTDADVPRFASNVRGQGTSEENRAAMAGSIGFFGSYTVDDSGEFSGNHVEGSTFPNWVGDTRSRRDLQLHVVGDRMTERFRRPDGTEIAITWQRVIS